MDISNVIRSQKWKDLPLMGKTSRGRTTSAKTCSLLLLLLVSCLTLCPSIYEAKLSDYIHHYESLDYASVDVTKGSNDGPVVVSRNRRTLLSEDDLTQEDRHRYHSHRQSEDRVVKIDFEALGRKFKLRLRPDAHSVFAEDLAVEGSDGNPIKLPLDHIYSGHLEDTANSHVFGSVSDGIFEGKILTPEGSYYVEKSHKYFKVNPSPSESQEQLEDMDFSSREMKHRKYYQSPPSHSSSSAGNRKSKNNNKLHNKTQDVDLYDFDDIAGLGSDDNYDDSASKRKVSNNSLAASTSDETYYSYNSVNNLNVTSTSTAPVNVVLLKDASSDDRESSSTTSTVSPAFHSVIYSSDAVKHPMLEKALGSGCASNIDPDVTQWMEKISNSVVREDIDLRRRNNNNNSDSLEESESHARSKRSPGRETTISGGVFGRQPVIVRPGFSQSSRDHPKEDSSHNIWSRNSMNAQSRIALEKFPPTSNLIPNQYPGSTVRKRACSLYIQTDTYLWEHIRKDASTDSKAREEIASLVAQHIKAVNHIYENSDFAGIRGLKFIVQRLRINDTSSCDSQSKKDHNPFCSPNIDVSNFLNLNSQFNHNDFCLAYIFTYRDFSGGTLGLAWVASTSGASGGICEKYKSYTENINGRQVQTKRSLNTGIITFVNYNSRVPPKVSELTLAHEIGHNFGSPHDYPMDCRPGGTQGNFIMYSSATSGERPNNNKFSPCSVRNISSVLSAVFNGEGKENCFQEDDGPFCGNKIVEEGEECDCGYDNKECTEQCCYPREVEPYLEYDPHAKPCTRRKGALCSPSEGPCCSEKCRYETSDKQCRHETECTLESFCNGYRAGCPGAPAKANKTECNGGTQVCWAGACVGSICQKYDLEECFLTSRSGAKPDEMCEVACQRLGDIFSCRRTSEIQEMRNISGLKLRPGSPCNDFQGYCDVFQRCRAVDAEGPLAMLKNLLFNHYTLTTIKQLATVSLILMSLSFI
jgi:disintegrin and metalloproteinase domain-containing protein 10